MARKLTTDDIQILKKLAPELVETTCTHSGHEFRSVLPPVSQHFSRSSSDFRERLVKLSDEELDHLVKLKAVELIELYKFAGE